MIPDSPRILIGLISLEVLVDPVFWRAFWSNLFIENCKVKNFNLPTFQPSR